ncbi:MAG: tetraacyldisaccharide 4'-kinase [Flammeovirgaceae bacterium]
MTSFLQYFLRPFSWIYGWLTDFWHKQYDLGKKPSVKFEIPVISVGNLTVGGTGKTPHIEYIIRLLKDKMPLAVLSRGYGRKTKGFVLADNQSSAQSIGDEPMQYYLKFGKNTSHPVTVAVGEERILAIPQILAEKPEIQVILLDDAFQHRKIRASLQILLCDYNKPFYEDYPFPAGRLRERRHGAKRSDIVIVSKCPESISDAEKEVVKNHLKPYLKENTPVFFTGIRYAFPTPLHAHTWETDTKEIILMTGIAQPKPLIEQLKNQFVIFEHFDYPDHHNYTMKDLQKVKKSFESIASNKKAILTTEKDIVKLKNPLFQDITKDLPIFFIGIEVYFLEGKEDFDKKIVDRINAL